MPQPLGLLIGFSGDLQELVVALQDIVGHAFVREALDVGVVYRLRALDTEFVLVDEHGLDDDCGIEFSAFEFMLDLTPFSVGAAVPGYGALYESMAKFLGARLCSRLPCRVVVVANLQREVARYGD